MLGSGGCKRKVIKVRKVIKKKKSSPAGERESSSEPIPTTPAASVASTRLSSPSSTATPSQEDYYQGSWSQWRNEPEYEGQWDKWQWPPAGWRPSRFHEAFYDQSSQYYRYNTFDWDTWDRKQKTIDLWGTPTEAAPTTPHAPTKSGEPISQLSRGSSEVSLVRQQLQRCSTSDQLAANLQNRLDEAEGDTKRKQKQRLRFQTNRKAKSQQNIARSPKRKLSKARRLTRPPLPRRKLRKARRLIRQPLPTRRLT